MIKIEREGRTVTAKLSAAIGWTFHFTHTCSDDAYAAYVRQDVSSKIFDTIKRIRQEAYNQGWSDKTKRKPKETWFSGNI